MDDTRMCRCGRRKYTKHEACYLCRAEERRPDNGEDITEDEIERLYAAARLIQKQRRQQAHTR